MKKKIIYPILAAAIFCGLVSFAFAEMESSNYMIRTSVLPGGGIQMSSSAYDVISTLGQPSPIMEPGDPQESSDYALYPGFWYTMEVIKGKVKYMPWIPLLLDD